MVRMDFAAVIMLLFLQDGTQLRIPAPRPDKLCKIEHPDDLADGRRRFQISNNSSQAAKVLRNSNASEQRNVQVNIEAEQFGENALMQHSLNMEARGPEGFASATRATRVATA